MNERNNLIYDLIFSEITDFKIDISDYIVDIYQYKYFVLYIKDILKKAKVKIIKSEINLSAITVIWELKIEK